MNLPPNPAAWPARWKELWSERAGIIEFEANQPREVAEYRAAQDIRKLAATERPQERSA